VVDDSEIKDGDCTYHEPTRLVLNFNNGFSKKIICHLPLNGAPVLEDVPLLPSLLKEDDVEKLAEQYVSANYPHYLNEKEKAAAIEDVCWGYNKAKEKYKYTEEDLKKACIMYAQWITGGTPSLRIAQNPGERFEQIIQSLQHHPKYPIAFECEMRTSWKKETLLEMEASGYNPKDYPFAPCPKIITNSQGRTEWVGKYIYE
jgi:hypothetical protein